ncbi:hypothetical protein [Candidatus Amarolinea dominans]|uniref:hypothetical protein n=1 Tax=Candidatus Amarolinea dominans TaxID=3140696 RepID=UPI0031363E5F|nr:hypothetical protein [Anaerolineae bacterium]
MFPNRPPPTRLLKQFLALSDYVPAADTAMLLEALSHRSQHLPRREHPAGNGTGQQSNEYDKTVGATTIEWDGQVETLPQAGFTPA